MLRLFLVNSRRHRLPVRPLIVAFFLRLSSTTEGLRAMSTRIGPTLAIAAIAALLCAPALAEGETATPQEQALSQGELDALVASIALSPDALLAQVLMASTCPLEVVQADRWARPTNR
jgi:Protein of unknown function (DUF3300)